MEQVNKKAIKYWLLTTEFPPFYGGGISTYCFNTARMLSENGYEITVFLPDQKVKDICISREGNIEIILFNPEQTAANTGLSYLANLSYAFAQVIIKTITLKGKPDIIEAQDYQGIAYYLLQFKFGLTPELQSIPIGLTLHSPAFVYLEYNKVPVYKFPDFWTCEMEKQSIISADFLISPSAYLPEVINKYLILDGLEISVIPNPIEGENTSEISPFNRNKVVYYGKLSVQKGSFELLSYFKELWDDGYQIPLHIIGGTDIVYHAEKNTMGNLIKEKYSGYIKAGLLHFTGQVMPEAASELVKNAHLVVFPSLIDNLPYAVIEMMQLGKVVLASDQGGQREIITHGIDGFLFDHNIENDFKNKILEILKLKEENIFNIGVEAQKTILKKFAYGTIFPLKHQLIQGLLGTKNKLQSHLPFVFQEPFKPFNSQEKNELLTVVIPFYNMSEYVLNAIESIQKSTYHQTEILVIDDGSGEAESQKLQELVNNVENIRVIRQKNQGLATTRNVGASLANGCFLAFLDADDAVEPEYYAKAIAILKAYRNVFFIGSWVHYFGDSDKIWPAFTPQPPYLLLHNPVNSSALVYKKEVFLKAGLNDNNLEFGLEDYESVINLLSKGYNGFVMPEPLFNYRVRSGSMFRSLNNTKLIYSYKYITEKHQNYFSKYAGQVINLLNANGPGYFIESPTEEVDVFTLPANRSKFKTIGKKILKKNPKLKAFALAILQRIK